MKTDRVRFEEKAVMNGATVLTSTKTVLEILATNNKMITTYYFDDNGKFEKINTDFVDSQVF